MLSPSFLENFPQPLVELYQELEEFVVVDVARRLKTAGQITSSAEFQKQQAELFNINNINQKVAQILKKSNSEIEKMLNEAAYVTIESENKTFKKAGYKTIELEESKALQDYLKTAIKQTKGDIENITRSMGFAEKQGDKIVYNSVAKFYQKELNLAHIKVSSGVQDYNTAIKQAANKISESGLRAITYNKEGKNYSINVDSAARRAVVTSVHQFNQETINHMANEIVPPDEQYAETTAHFPCRPTHLPWQGRTFKVNGSSPGYPNLAEATDLGSVTGLEGIGCKHSYFTFIKDVSVRTYSDAELKEMERKSKGTFDYKDQKYTPYKATQYQRQLENQIRKLKRENLIYKETGLEQDVKATNTQIRELTKEYKEFSSIAEIKAKMNRTQI